MLSQQKFVAFAAFFLFLTPVVFAQTVPTAQQASGQESLRQMQERDKKLRGKIEHPRKEEAAPAEAPAVQPEENAGPSQKALINKIIVSGNAILSRIEIAKIVGPFEGKEMDVRDMQKVADLITDAYRKKGFITTRAILLPQKVVNNTLELKVVLGLMGDLEVRGNRYFKKSLFTKRVGLKKGDLFNYNALRDDLRIINQYPDRNVKTVITPGKEPGQTDVVFDVKDRQPMRIDLAYDNFGSRYIGKNRYTATGTDYNFLGFDDALTFQYQTAEMRAYRLTSLRYQVPLSKYTDIGIYGAHNQTSLKEEFKDLNARGKSKLYGAFVNQLLVNKEDLKVTASGGFDYKDVYNFQLGVESSRDRERVAKGGFNIDYADPWNGRNIFNNETDFGIPNIMGGLRDVDPRSSRVGAGGEFVKDLVDYLRLQRLPFDSSLLIKTEAQFASTILPATEQYQLGGIANVRGFAPGEAVGDSGQSVTSELSFPLYGVPKSVSVPFSRARLYDALRLAAFYDWGHVTLRNPQAGELKQRSIDSLGWGVRFNLPENFSFRIDFAWPVKGRPSDQHNEHTWIQITKEF